MRIYDSFPRKRPMHSYSIIVNVFFSIQPSFGVHENSRILDIFKDRKKKRKKQLKEAGGKVEVSPKKRELSPPDSGEDRAVQMGGRESKGNGNAKSKKGKGNVKLDENVTTKDKDARAGKHPQLQAARMRLGGIGQRQNKKQHQSDNPNGGPPISPSSMQKEASGRSTTNEAEAPDTPDPSRLSLEDSAPTKQQSPHETMSRSATNASAAPSLDALFIVVPRNELPDPLPGEAEPSLAVPAARQFVNTYYQHFSAARINDLARYYTAKGQKSVSIGGAHSVVTGRNDITTQIFSLAGTAFDMKGVVSQDTVDGQGAHILVTGTAVTGSGGVTANFAHSVSLTRVEAQVESTCSALEAAFEVGVPFQIHNDALALLSGEAAPINQPQFTTPVTATAHQPPPPPPPGLF